ncbi:MAG: SagB/ThcOx family dehydrogenase [Desulfobacterales bacterium]
MSHTVKSYHRYTAYDRYNMSPHYLDWASQPAQFKNYPEVTTVSLPEVADIYRTPLIKACQNGAEKPAAVLPGAAALARIFTLACGLTARARQPGGDFYFRSAPSAGALYPNEVYLVWPGSSELAAGLYHFGFQHRKLVPLRTGYFARVFEQAFGTKDETPGPRFLVSGIFFRSAWKYRSRAYRYVLLDAGHLIENLRLAVSAARFAARLELAFDDLAADQLLGVDPDREGCIGGLKIPVAEADSGAAAEPRIDPLPEEFAEASRVSEKEIEYEAILDIHRAGRKLTGSGGPSSDDPTEALGLTADVWTPLAAIAPDDQIAGIPVMDYAEASLRRRSRRNFVKAPMTADQFAYLINLLSEARGRAVQNQPDDVAQIVCGCLVGNVSGMAPGFYLLDMEKRQLGRIYTGDKRGDMTGICLNQAWLANAAVHFVLMTNLECLDEAFGARGYRYAMIGAGRLGHLLYLGANALGMGCCGIGAFYDGEARQLLGLNEASDMLYLLAVGQTKTVR